MGKFTPKWIVCNKDADSFKYSCKTIHINGDGFPTNNTYRFTGKPLKYLVKNKEDYEEMVALSHFEDYVEPSEKLVSEKSETTKERKLREKAEAEANKEAAKAKVNEDGGDKMEETEIEKTEETTEEVESNVEKSDESEETENPSDSDSGAD